MVIYQIYCITNATVYIGKTADVGNRWWYHRRQLQLNEHSNRHLQRAWTKYGAQAFKFEIINIVDAEQEALDLERYWIATLRQCGVRLFNQTDGGEGTPGYVPSSETRERIASKHRGTKRTIEQRIRIAEAHTNGRRLTFISPDGTIYPDVANISLFAEQHGLKSYSLNFLVEGRIRQHRGWKLDGFSPERGNLRAGTRRDPDD